MSEVDPRRKNYVVTGGTSGIGKAVVRALATKSSGNVIFCGTNKESGEALAHDLANGAAGIVEFVYADVTDGASLECMFRHVERKFEYLHGAFNAAGISGKDSLLRGVSFHESNEDQFDRVIDVNLKGLWRSLRHELSIMVEQGHGAIVNCASVAGLRCADSMSASYTASKHAVVGISRALAVEYARHGLRVNAVCPGVIDTPMLGDMHQALLSDLRRKNPAARIGTPQDVAESVLFLLSESSSYISGTTLTVDAGGLQGAL